MKRIAVIIAVFLVPVLTIAQSGTIDKLIDKYGGQDGVTVVNINPELFQVLSEMDIEQVRDAAPAMDKLSVVKVLAVENPVLLEGNNFYNEVTEDLNMSDYAEVLTVKDGSEDVRMWMKTEGKQIRDFLLVVSSPDEGVVVYISGDFNMNDIEGLAQSFGGLEELEGLEEIEIH